MLIKIFGFCDLSLVSGHLTHLAESELVSANESFHFFLNLFSGTVSNRKCRSRVCSPVFSTGDVDANSVV